MLHERERHEALKPIQWDETRVCDAIADIVAGAERSRLPDGGWPWHPHDVEPGDDTTLPATPLRYGACGTAWALQYLQQRGAVALAGDPLEHLDELLRRQREWQAAAGLDVAASYLCGDTPFLMMSIGQRPDEATASKLAALIEANLGHPARELMWGAPGTMLAALLLHRRFGGERWADFFRRSAETLWSQLEWSAEHGCRYWTQDLYGRRSSYLGAVHGFAATASVLIGGRELLDPAQWQAWHDCIVGTVQRTASIEGDQVNWRPQLESPRAQPTLMQFCHGAPGFVVCLAAMPGTALDDLLLGAGRAIWAAGPLAKGANLCHGTAGNGYAFLKLYRRSGDAVWLDRARAFAMHAIAQSEAEALRLGQRRWTLWTGDLGLAVYLWDCVQRSGDFPTLDVFYGDTPAR